MNIRIIIIGALVIALIGLGSCKKYLEVTPNDKLLESQLFSTPAGVRSALNEVYLKMAQNSLYGGNLTMSTLELMGQHYQGNPTAIGAYYGFDAFEYTRPKFKQAIDSIWSAAYVNIANLNKFLENIEQYKGVVGQQEESILKGEAYGLRAMLHFDLLRIYGPVYSVTPTALSIPYYSKLSTITNPLLPAKQVIDSVLSDLSKAKIFLAQDPIITSGKSETLMNDGKDFLRFRNLALNFYAVRALEARVQLYAGNKTAALTAATSVITEGTKWFPWTEAEEVIAAGLDPDRIFSKEVLFAVQNVNLYNQQQKLFVFSSGGASLLYPNDVQLMSTYEQDESDYRLRSSWINSTPGLPDRTFIKYADVADNTKTFRFMQPLIRMSEMYYIAAESTTDPTAALTFLNTVRFRRGLSDLDAGTDINEALKKEYGKEFYGEGQLFFYYKRKNTSEIPYAAYPYDWLTWSMDAAKYVVPLPESETNYR